MKKIFKKGFLGLALIPSTFLTINFTSDSSNKTILSKEINQNSKDNTIKTPAGDLTIDSVIPDIQNVTINYSYDLDDSTGVQLWIYDASGATEQPIAFQSDLTGQFVIEGLEADKEYSNWVARLNWEFDTIDTEYLPNFTTLSKHEINDVTIVETLPSVNMVQIKYDIDTNIQDLDLISVEVKDGAGNSLVSGKESEFNGSIIVNGLEGDETYSGWTLEVKSIKDPSASAMVTIPDFTTNTGSEISNLEVDPNIETTFNSATISYTVDTNVASENLKLYVLDKGANVVYEEHDSVASGTILITGLEESTTYSDWTLVAAQEGHEDLVNKETPIHSFRTKLESPVIEELNIVSYSYLDGNSSLKVNFNVKGNIDDEDYKVEVFDQDGNLVANGIILGRNISNGYAIISGLPAGTYSDFKLKLTYKFDETVFAETALLPFTLS